MTAQATVTPNFRLNWTTGNPLDLVTIAESGLQTWEPGTYATGTGASQVDRVFTDERSVATTVDDDLTLSALAESIFGSSVSIVLAKLKFLWILNKNAVSGDDLTIDTSVTHGATFLTGGASGKIVVPAGAAFFMACPIPGWTVTASTNDVLRIHNGSSHTVVYDIMLAGTHA